MAYQMDISPAEVGAHLEKHILKDGFDMVMDLQKSHGSYVYDAHSKREMLDFFTCFATVPLGYNHPKMVNDEAFRENLFWAAMGNPSNSDIYTAQYAHFIDTFGRVGIPDYLPHAFFIAGGGLAIENALKAAMDWKVQKNFERGYTHEHGLQVLHFREAFHGRTGYTMSLTNTDPNKTKYFAKFEDWPRVLNPKIHFPYSDANHDDLVKRERLSLRQIERTFETNPHGVCAIIIEPIQGEGGDNHFRPEFMRDLRRMCDHYEALLIFDEVQMGMGATGKFWAHQHFGAEARPDLIAFGKKMQVCGVLGGPRLHEVEHNVFTTPSRINSTWGGNLVDMVRADKIMQIMEEDHILEHVTQTGEHFLARLQEIGQKHPKISNIRGRGLILACDFPDGAHRNAFIKHGLKHDVLFLGCAERTVRFRPTLTMSTEEIDQGLAVMDTVLTEMGL